MKNIKIIFALLFLVGAMMFTSCEDTNEEPMGTLYSLQEAYDNGFITQDDILHIVYFLNGSIFESIPVTVDGEIWIRDDFIPQIETPALSMLDKNIISDMKKAFYAKHQKGLDSEMKCLKNNSSRNKSENVIDTISVNSFLGKYNDSYAVRVTSNLIEYGTGNFFENVAGVEWSQFGLQVTIYRVSSTGERDE